MVTSVFGYLAIQLASFLLGPKRLMPISFKSVSLKVRKTCKSMSKFRSKMNKNHEIPCSMKTVSYLASPMESRISFMELNPSAVCGRI